MKNQSISNKATIVAMAGVALFVGVIGGSLLQIVNANAQNSTSNTTANTSTNKTVQQIDPSQATHVGTNGKREELLTGDTAEKVRAAALKAVQGGTIQRVETEVDGKGVYEAHMTNAEGQSVTVYFDNNFNVTSQDEGFGKMKAR